MSAVRDWDRATVAAGGSILLDGRELHLPGGERLRVRGAALAHAIAAEWDAAGGGRRGGRYDVADLTLTRLAATETVQVAADRDAAVAALLRAADTDMLCYRAEVPAGLVRRQEAAWQPQLDWIEGQTGVRFAVTVGVMPAAQPPAVASALQAAIDRLDEASLASLLAVVPALGSLVLGLAFLAKRLAPEEAASVAGLEAAWEAELWGDREMVVARQAKLSAELALVRRYLALREADE